MSISKPLEERSGNACELCGSASELSTHIVSPKEGQDVSEQIAVCDTCAAGIGGDLGDMNHWRCLNDSMWSAVPAVQVSCYRLLHEIGKTEGWALEARDTMYMEEDTAKWAKRGLEDESIVHKDSNGNVLSAGDTVTLIKDLNVKGGGFTAKRGTAVRRISLVADNENHIEGVVEGQRIVILTEFVKKS